MTEKKNHISLIKLIYSVVIGLLPVLVLLKFNVAGINIDRILLIVFSLLSLIPALQKGKFRVRGDVLVSVALYCLWVTLNALYFNSCGIFGMVSVWIIIFFGLCYTIPEYLDFATVKKVVIFVSVLAAVSVIAQSILYYAFGIYWSPIPRNLYRQNVIESYSGFLGTGLDRGLFRPSGFFLEPAHLAEYCVVGLISSLIDDNPKFNISILISIGIVFTTSGIGIILASLVWIFVLFFTQERKYHFSFKKFAIVIIVVIVIITVLDNIGVGSAIWNRFKIANVGTGFSSRFSDVSIAFSNFTLKEFFFGEGFDSPTNYWLSGLFSIVRQIGIIGLICFLNVLVLFYRRSKTFGKCLILVYFGLLLSAEVSNMTYMSFYIGIAFSSFAMEKSDRTQRLGY